MTKRKLWWLVIVSALAAGLILDPVVGLIRESLGGGGLSNYGDWWQRANSRAALFGSLKLSILTVLGTAAVAIPLSLLTHRQGRVGQGLQALAMAPLFMPPVLGTVCFYFLCDRGGVLSRLIPGADWDFRGFPAVLTVHILSFAGQFLALVQAGLERIDPARIEAARTLGAGRVRCLLRVVLPELRPSIVAASILVFLASMASFTAPFVFGGGEAYLTTAIYESREREPALAAAEAVILALCSLSALGLFARSPARTLATSGRRAPGEPGRLRSLRLGLASLLAIPLALPLFTLLVVALKPGGRLGQKPLLADLSLNNFAELASGSGSDLVPSLVRSSLYAFIATGLALVWAVLLVVVGRNAPAFWRRFQSALAMIPLAIPGTVLGLSLITTFDVRGPYLIGPGLLGTSSLLVLAYVVRHLPLMVQAAEAGMAKLSDSVPEAARTLGAGPLRTLLRVTLPAIRPMLQSGAVLAFLGAFGEFVASILIATPLTKPASIVIYEDFRAGLFGPAAAAGVLFVGVAVLLTFAMRWVSRGR